MDTDIVQLAKTYKEAQKALAKARKALVAAMDRDAREASKPVKAKKAAPAKAKKAAPAKARKAAPAKAKKVPKVNWTPYRTTLIRKMKKGQWITGFDARVFSGHERGPGFTQHVLTHFLNKGILKKRKVKNTTQWSLK